MNIFKCILYVTMYGCLIYTQAHAQDDFEYAEWQNFNVPSDSYQREGHPYEASPYKIWNVNRNGEWGYEGHLENKGEFQAQRCAESQAQALAQARAETQAYAQAYAQAQALAQEQAQTQVREQALAQAQAEVQAYAQAYVQSQAQSQEQAKAKAEVQAQLQAQLEAQSRMQAEVQAQTQAELLYQLQLKAQANAQLEAQLDAQFQAQCQAREQAHAQTQAELQAQLQIEAQAKAKLEAQLQTQAELYSKAYSQAQIQIQAQAQAQAKAQAKVQAYAQAQAEAYAQEQAQVLAQIQAQAQAQAKSQAKAQAQAYTQAYAQAYAQAQMYAQNVCPDNPLTQANIPNPNVCNVSQNSETYCREQEACCEEIAFPCETCCPECPWDIMAKVGLVYPISKKLQHFYSSAFPIYEIEGSYHGCNGWGGWANLAYASKKGHAEIDLNNCTECELDESDLRSGTRMQIVQLGLGVEYVFDLSCSLSAYLGAGLTYSFLRIKNDSDFVKRKINKNGAGGILKSGISYYFTDCFHADLFLDYTITQFSLKHFDYQTINFGIGIGSSF